MGSDIKEMRDNQEEGIPGTGTGECQGHETSTCLVFWQRAASEG